MFGWLRSKASRHRALDALDLTSVRDSLATKAGWPIAKTVQVERSYREFLGLMIDWPKERHVPTMDVDEFWHWHVLDSRKYEADCKSVFGKVIHHDPHFAKGTPEHTAAFAKTRARLDASGARTRGGSSNDARSAADPAACGGGVDPILAAVILSDDGSRADAPAHVPSAPSYHGPAEAPDPSPSYGGSSYGGSSYDGGGSDSGSSGGSSCSSSSSCSSGSSCGGGGCGGGGD